MLTSKNSLALQIVSLIFREFKFQVNDAGLCYDPPRDGYSCQATACQQDCAVGTVSCGLGACADSASDCGQNIARLFEFFMDLV